MVFHWSLSDSKSSQVSRTLLSILAVLNYAVVWRVSTRSPTSKSFSPFNNPLITVPKAPITIDIIFTFMFYISFNFCQGRDNYPSLLLSFFIIIIIIMDVIPLPTFHINVKIFYRIFPFVKMFF